MPRLPDLDPAALDPRQSEVYQAIIQGPRGAVEGPLRVWLNSPELADRAQALGQFARYDSSLPPDLSELAILVTARIWGSGFEWAHHAPLALAAGLSSAAVDAIALAHWVEFSDDRRNAVFACSVELHRDRAINEDTYRAGIAALGVRGMVDLVGICGYYTLISMTINAFEVPDGSGPALPRLELDRSHYFRTASAQVVQG